MALRAISEAHPVLAGGVLPVAVMAVDLKDSLGTRVRGAGNRVLQELLDELR